MDAWHRSFELPVTILRPFNTYGPRQSARAVIPTIISQALAGDDRSGSARCTRAATSRSSTDTAAGFVAAAAVAGRASGRTIQLGTGARRLDRRARRAWSASCSAASSRSRLDPARVRPEKSEVQRLISDPSLARELLGWDAEVDLREGWRARSSGSSANAARYRVDHYVI